MNAAVIFWPQGGSVEKSANTIAGKLNTTAQSVSDFNFENIDELDLIVLGGSTVGSDHWENSSYKDAWTQFFVSLEGSEHNLKAPKVAIFGLGNQILYPEHFVDSMKNIADSVKAVGGDIIGQVSTEGYDFIESEAVVGDQFIGLPLDEDSQAELSEDRITCWTKGLTDQL